MRILLLSLCTLMLFSVACKKNNDPTKNATLPAATQEGKNTIGFTLDGEVWVPYARCKSFNSPCRTISVQIEAANATRPNRVEFSATRERQKKSSYLYISALGQGTISSIGNKVDSISATFLSENSSGNDGYYFGVQPGSTFVITKYDIQNQIMSGEFILTLLEQNGSGKTITLREGRFDFRFNACRCSQ